MGFTVNRKLIEDAAKAPKIFIEASLGEDDEYNREPGMQLTKEQIISLRKYETLGLSLPIRLQDIIAYLNYGAGDKGGVGLKAEDFQRTFTMTYDHAKRWSPLREKIMLTGTDLKIFGGSIIRIGGGIVEIYEDLKASKYLEEHNINTPEEYLKLKREIPNLPDLGLPAGDVPEIKDYLKDMLAKVKQCHDKAQRVKVELNKFGTDMREKVLPEIKLRLEFISKNTYQADIQILQKNIDDRAAEIDDLNNQYNKLVEEAIKSAVSFNIAGLIMGIYQGVKAEGIRKERNKLKEEQQAANEQMASKNQTLSSLNKVRDDLQNLSYVAIEAEVATQNLMLVWNALSAYIAASVEEVDKLEDAISLRKFKNQILSIIDPWEQIKVSSDQLLAVFAAADREYENGGLIFSRRSLMMPLFDNSNYPRFSVKNLRGHNALVQQGNTTAQMLFQQYDYLPGEVATMNDLALSINKRTFDVRDIAQTNVLNLERTERKLKGYLTELGDPSEEKEIHDDMEQELNNISNKLSAQTRELSSIHKAISITYDRNASKVRIETLQLDKAFQEQLKAASEERLEILKGQIKSVAEAIDLVGKAGVEKIGQEAALTLENLQALGLAPPQIQIALLAVDMLKKIASGIGEIISYLNMLASYKELKGRAVELKAQVEAYANVIAKFNGKIELVATLDELDADRWEYVNEFSNLITDFESFAGDVKQDKSLPVEDRTVAVIAKIPEVIKYLKTIQNL